MKENKILAYKVIKFNHSDNTVVLLGEFNYSDDGYTAASLCCQEAKDEDPSQDEDYLYTFEIVSTYRFNTKLGDK